MDMVFVLAGLAFLLGGGDALVRGGGMLAVRLGLPMAVVGAVVLGFGTSMPELLTSLSAAWAGAPGIAVGNVVGSNIANILLIVGLAAVLAPIPARDAPAEDRVWLALATLIALALLVLRPELGRIEGALLLFVLAVYLWRAVRRDAGPGPVAVAPGTSGPWQIAGLVLGGIGSLIAGAWLLVEGASNLARAVGVTETTIGLTVVAVGTSLPELATSLVAARRGQAGLAVGNVLGSNVFNVLAILGTTAALIPIPVPPMLSSVDLAVFSAATLLLLIALAAGGVRRGTGVTFLSLYAAYVGWLALSAA